MGFLNGRAAREDVGMQVILTMHLEEGDLALSQRSAVLHLLHLFGRSEEEAAAQQLQGGL